MDLRTPFKEAKRAHTVGSCEICNIWQYLLIQQNAFQNNGNKMVTIFLESNILKRHETLSPPALHNLSRCTIYKIMFLTMF